jgi:arylsulfatase A-like enzyme
MNAIIVVVDRLGAGLLGSYGNTWLDTPHLNRLASESLLFEFATADSPRLDRLYRSYWRGIHAAAEDRNRPTGDAAWLVPKLRSSGVATVLVTDEPELAELPASRAFHETVRVPARETERIESASDLAETDIARLVVHALEHIAEDSGPQLAWVHSRGLAGAWDAPWELRQQFADEEDPDAPHFLQPPELLLPPDYDPDELLGITHAAAGQVVAIDACLGTLLAGLHDSGIADDALLVFTSPRGFPLGEHRRVGPIENALYGELLHVPLMLRFPDGRGAMARSPTLAQPPDLFATLLEWFGQAAGDVWGRSLLGHAESQHAPLADRAGAAGTNERAIRTPGWFLRISSDADGASTNELFAKPDDRWEANEVASRCPEVVEQLAAALSEFERAARMHRREDLASLPAWLAETP